jgi:hypothetical protein
VTTTTHDALGKTEAQFRATWERILAQAGTARPHRAAGRPEALCRNYAVERVTSAQIRDEARRWSSQWPMPDWISRDVPGWSEAMASLINGRAGWLARKYWGAVREEVFVTARGWPTVADLHDAALSVAKREGV